MVLFCKAWIICTLLAAAGVMGQGPKVELSQNPNWQNSGDSNIDLVEDDIDDLDNNEQGQQINEDEEDLEEKGEKESDPEYYSAGPSWQGALCPKYEPDCKYKNIIAYMFDNSVGGQVKQAIQSAIKHIERHVKCIDFEEITAYELPTKIILGTAKKTVGDYMRFKEGDVCKTTYGLRGKDNEKKLLGHEIFISPKKNGCAFRGGVLHQILHAFGFAHEHAREDRDKHVVIHTANIKPGYETQFDKVPSYAQVQWKKGDPYDFASIMHFPEKRYGKMGSNNKRLSTISILTKTDKLKNFFSRHKLGQRKSLSKIDVKRLRSMWGC